MSRSIMGRVVEKDSSDGALLGRDRVENDVEASVRVRTEEESVIERHLTDGSGKRPQVVGSMVRAKCEPWSAARDQSPRARDRFGLRTLDVHLEVGGAKGGKDVIDRDALHHDVAGGR